MYPYDYLQYDNNVYYDFYYPPPYNYAHVYDTARYYDKYDSHSYDYFDPAHNYGYSGRWIYDDYTSRYYYVCSCNQHHCSTWDDDKYFGSNRCACNNRSAFDNSSTFDTSTSGDYQSFTPQDWA